MTRPILDNLSVAAMAAAVSTASAALADDLPQRQGWTPNGIAWQTQGADGTRFALLEGVRDKPGTAFSYAFFIPAGVWDAPHSHSVTARVFVARGTLRIGYGASADTSRAVSYPADSYVIVPANAVHYDGADEDTVIIGTATGPWSTTYLNGSKPASAGTPVLQ